MKEPILEESPNGEDHNTPEINQTAVNNEISSECDIDETKEDNGAKEETSSFMSDIGCINTSTTLDFKLSNEAPSSQLLSEAENVIETINTETLVSNSYPSIDDPITRTEEKLRPNCIVNNISDKPKCSEEFTEICGVLINRTEDLAGDGKLSEESPSLRDESQWASTPSQTNQCTIGVNYTNTNNQKLEQTNDIPNIDIIVSQDVKTEVVSNVCQAIVRSIRQEVMEDMVEKVVKETQEIEPVTKKTNGNLETKIDVLKESKEKDEKMESKEMLENSTQSKKPESIEAAEEIPQNQVLTEEKQKEIPIESKELSKGECLSQQSDDYYEIEKSDGSDSGIGSELIDEAITKSSDSSSSNSSSDEFNSAPTSQESWATPCISFAEMSEIDFGAGPRLSIPTFDDLTMTCDVLSGEKKPSEIEEKQVVKEQDAPQNPESNRVVAASDKGKTVTIDSDEDIDISSIDDDEPNKAELSSFISVAEPVSYVPATLLRELSSIPSTSRQTSFKSSLKRTRGHSEVVPPSKRFKSQGIRFDSVSVYYFPRTQGFTCVPSQGGSTLGMSWHHSHVQTFTLSQYAQEQRRVHQRLSRSPFCSQGSGDSISGCDSNDDSDSDDPISDTEFDSDSSYSLQPVKIRQRRAMLRAAGVDKIDPAEKNECRQIRISREFVGCTCEGFCDPEICACALAGIKCQVDRQSFPCGCSRDCCANPRGRIEFNPGRVHSHYVKTITRIKAQKKDDDDDDLSRMYDYQQYHTYHPPEFEPSSISSYYPQHHPQYLPSSHHELLSNFELQHQMHSCYEPFNSELMSTSYTGGEGFNNNTSAVGISSDYPYNTLTAEQYTSTAAYQREDNSTNGTEHYSLAFDQSQYQSTCSQNYPTVTESSSHEQPKESSSLDDKVSFASSLGYDSSEVKTSTVESVLDTDNFAEIISKTMTEEVIV